MHLIHPIFVKHTHIRTKPYTYKCVCIRMCVWIRVCTYHIHLCMNAGVHAHTLHTRYTHTYTHTRTHTQSTYIHIYRVQTHLQYRQSDGHSRNIPQNQNTTALVGYNAYPIRGQHKVYNWHKPLGTL